MQDVAVPEVGAVRAVVAASEADAVSAADAVHQGGGVAHQAEAAEGSAAGAVVDLEEGAVVETVVMDPGVGAGSVVVGEVKRAVAAAFSEASVWPCVYSLQFLSF